MGTNLASSAAACPFCKGAVPQDTLRFGGNCPHCMLEIPGEEAPTDPGLAARQRKAEEDKVAEKKATTRRRGVVAAISLVALLGLVGAAVEYQRWEAATRYEVEPYPMLDFSELPDAPEEPVADVATPNPATPGVRAPKPRTGPTTNAAASVGTPVPDAGTKHVDAGTAGDAEVGLTAAATTSVESGGSIGVGARSADTVLSDEGEIRSMIGRLLRSYKPQIVNCYNQRLKVIGNLEGTWNVQFTIGKDGLVSAVSVRGAGAKDAELEACMSRQVQAWRFQKIARPQPVSNSYPFKAF